MKREEVDAVFERHDPAIQQIARAHLLASKVVDQQNSTVRFDLERRFIKFVYFIVNKIEPFEG